MYSSKKNKSFLLTLNKNEQAKRINILKHKYPADTIYRKKIREFVLQVASEYDLCGPIVDIGSGFRSNEPEVCNSYLYDFYTVDIDPKMKADFILDAMALPDEWADLFSTVVCTELLEHVPRPWQVIREIRKILKPRGRLILTVPFWVPIHEKRQLIDYWRFTSKGVLELLDGFIIILVVTSGSKTKPLGIYVLAQKASDFKIIL